METFSIVIFLDQMLPSKRQRDRELERRWKPEELDLITSFQLQFNSKKIKMISLHDVRF